MRTRFWLAIPLALTLISCGDGPAPERAQAASAPETAGPLIIAHRGASGLYPEHTLEAYGAAIDMGADFIEPDLVMTKDGVLVARHERLLSVSTNVADRPEFAGRLTMKDTETGPREDWYVEDFTLAELKTLRARQARPGRSTEYDNQFAIPTFTEILGLVAASNSPGQSVGVYPELKEPAYFASLGFDMETALLDALDAAGLRTSGVPVFIQCFEPETLRSLNSKTDWPLVQLLPATTDERLMPEQIALYADGVGPWKQIVMQSRGGPQAYMDAAHEHGLFVHAYTFRADDVAPYAASFEAELQQAFAAGIDGIFTDHPQEALAVRDGS